MIAMFCGSRYANGRLLDLAHRAVERARELGWHIIVGDAPGVDAEVIKTSDTCTVLGAFGKLRCETDGSARFSVVPGDYVGRDDILISRADIVVCIWNGKSSGTLRNYARAKKLGKTAYLIK
jgi:predicted Rossmann fold nucleotide-binding protein DprA/Smf involved in DNA uptake